MHQCYNNIEISYKRVKQLKNINLLPKIWYWTLFTVIISDQYNVSSAILCSHYLASRLCHWWLSHPCKHCNISVNTSLTTQQTNLAYQIIKWLWRQITNTLASITLKPMKIYLCKTKIHMTVSARYELIKWQEAHLGQHDHKHIKFIGKQLQPKTLSYKTFALTLALFVVNKVLISAHNNLWLQTIHW